MAIDNYIKKVSGVKKKGDIVMFTLSTCVWCMKTKNLMKELGLEHGYIDVDLLEGDAQDEVVGELKRYNPAESFPTIVIDGKKTILGFQEAKIRELAK